MKDLKFLKLGHLWLLKDQQSGDREGKSSASDSGGARLGRYWRSLGFPQKNYPLLSLERISKTVPTKHFGTFAQRLSSDLFLMMNWQLCFFTLPNIVVFRAKPDRKKDEETARSTKRLSLRKEYQQADCQTIGQYLALNKEHQRNRVENYEFMTTRSLLIEEAQLIFEKQREFGKMLPEEFEYQFVEILCFQRPLQSTEDLVGYCSLLPSEKRAPLSTP